MWVQHTSGAHLFLLGSFGGYSRYGRTIVPRRRYWEVSPLHPGSTYHPLRAIVDLRAEPIPIEHRLTSSLMRRSPFPKEPVKCQDDSPLGVGPLKGPHPFRNSSVDDVELRQDIKNDAPESLPHRSKIDRFGCCKANAARETDWVRAACISSIASLVD